MKQTTFPTAKEADIALLLEGSYPFIVGGVSSWMHQIIQAFPQYKFAIIFLGSTPEDYTEGLRYELPKNVVHLEVHYLYDQNQENITHAPKRKTKESQESFHLMRDFLHQQAKDSKFNDLDFFIDVKHFDNYKDFFRTKISWDFIVNNYDTYCTDPSFIDYFWTIMHIQKPIWTLTNIAQNFIKVKAVHTISTGYAGLLGSLVCFKHNQPLVLTEHGIYTKERRIELLQSDMVAEADAAQKFGTELGYIRDLWMRYFDLLSQICYNAANPIISLFSQAQKKQIEEGANPKRTEIIFNGIDIKKYSGFRKLRPTEVPPILALIGRVVPIKDIKTFIRSMNVVAQHIPDAQGWIVGPTNENEEYYEECMNLVAVLDLEKNVKFFPGRQDLSKFFPKIALTILSSISEGMPLIVLEGFAAGVPAITTDVGACRALIMGDSDEDKKLGAAGDIVPIAAPQELANAAVKLLKNQKTWQQAQQAGIKRVEKYYDEKMMFKQYAKVYEDALKTTKK